MVQAQIAAALDAAPPGPLRAVSMCAGQGRDLIPVLASHPRGRDVTARLVELDPGLAATARRAAADASLPGVEVVTGDASLTDVYAGWFRPTSSWPAGIRQHLRARHQAHRRLLAQLCATGGTTLWTRGRGAPDLVPQICGWFSENGFELSWLSEPGVKYGVGAHRFTAQPRPLVAACACSALRKTEDASPSAGHGREPDHAQAAHPGGLENQLPGGRGLRRHAGPGAPVSPAAIMTPHTSALTAAGISSSALTRAAGRGRPTGSARTAASASRTGRTGTSSTMASPRPGSAG